ncbi:hypothetical protein [Streptomyces sp. CA-106131]|uniref:hypothetical protein n=1 Tax=Streptomyces sp. CA-106131 TaxID=3240045 RepID=UPI003D8B2424
MPVIADIVNNRTAHGPATQTEFHSRVTAFHRVKGMVKNYMTPDEAAYWKDDLISEFLWSLPNKDVQTLANMPYSPDLRPYFDDCVMDLAYAKNVIEALMG